MRIIDVLTFFAFALAALAIDPYLHSCVENTTWWVPLGNTWDVPQDPCEMALAIRSQCGQQSDLPAPPAEDFQRPTNFCVCTGLTYAIYGACASCQQPIPSDSSVTVPEWAAWSSACGLPEEEGHHFRLSKPRWAVIMGDEFEANGGSFKISRALELAVSNSTASSSASSTSSTSSQSISSTLSTSSRASEPASATTTPQSSSLAVTHIPLCIPQLLISLLGSFLFLAI